MSVNRILSRPIDVRLLPSNPRKRSTPQWMLLTPFEYHVGSENSTDVIVVPTGEVTDFASIPRFLHGVYPPAGPWAGAAVIHDYLYRHRLRTKDEADNIFYEAMGVIGVPQPRRYFFYLAVHWFGRGNWK